MPPASLSERQGSRRTWPRTNATLVPTLHPTAFSALSAFYRSTGGADRNGRFSCLLEEDYTSSNCSWRNAEHWLEGLPCTKMWHGLTCVEGEPTALKLQGNFLRGPIPSQLGLVTTLAGGLVLEENPLNGPLPTQLGSLTRLGTGNHTKTPHHENWGLFYISYSSITGPIPSEIGRLTALNFALGMYCNQLSGTIPSELGRLSKLRSAFDIRTNALAGTLPTELGQLTQLRTDFSVTRQSLSGTIPTELGRLSEMKAAFCTEENRLSGGPLPTQLGKLSEMISVFTMHNDGINGTFPTELSRLSKMTYEWKLEGNNYKGSTLPTEFFGSMSHLVGILTIGGASLAGSIPSEIGKMSLLRKELRMEGNNFEGSLPTEIGLLRKMRSDIQLYMSSLQGTLPTEVGMLTSMQEGLQFQLNSLSGMLPTELGKLTRMSSELFLSQNRFTNSIPSELCMLSKLQTLSIFSNSFTGTIPSEIAALTSLSQMILYDNSLQGTMPSGICNFTDLFIVAISKNSLNGRLPQCTFPQMQIFDVSNNKFHGPLPSMKGWKIIEYMALHGNAFSAGLGALQLNASVASSQFNFHDDTYWNDHGRDDDYYLGGNLVGLTVHDNKLDEPIPVDLSLPETIEYFTISNNRIPGRVPQNLLQDVNLTRAQLVLLSNNRLSCELPRHKGSAPFHSLVLVGNLFSALAPAWVSSEERKVTFLQTANEPVRYDRNLWLFPTWMSILPIVAAIPFCYIAAKAVARRLQSGTQMISVAASLGDDRVAFLARLARGTTLFAGAAVTCLLPVIVRGASYFECGDALTKFTTMAYLADSKSLEWTAAVVCIGYTFGLARLLAFFIPPKHHAEENREDGGILCSGAGAHETAWHTRSLKCWAQAFGILTVWFMMVLIFGGSPTVLYVMTYSLPNDNIFDDILPSSLVSSLHHFLAFYLSVASSWIIPACTSPTARLLLSVFGFSATKHQHALQTIISIIGRTIIVVVIPIISVVWFNDGCFGAWKSLWTSCQPNSDAFDIEDLQIGYYSGQEAQTQLGQIQNVNTGDIKISLLNRASICAPSYRYGTCGRNIISLLGPIFTSKLIYAVLFSLIEPPCSILKAKFFRWLEHRRRTGSPESSKHEPLLADGEDAREKPDEDHADSEEEKRDSPDTTITLLNGPDPMLRLIWFESAFTFGAVIPPLLPLLALQLHADTRAFAWQLHETTRSTAGQINTKGLPIVRQAMQCHILLVLALHSLMTGFFFFDSGLHGRRALAVALGVIWTGFLLSQFYTDSQIAVLFVTIIAAPAIGIGLCYLVIGGSWR